MFQRCNLRLDQNLSGSQKELLLWHQHLGHASFKHIQHLFALPKRRFEANTTSQNQRVGVCDLDLPRCEACQYAKQKCRPTSTVVNKSMPDREGSLSDCIIAPGQMVSVDLYQSTILGRLPQTKGKRNLKSILGMERRNGDVFLSKSSQLVGGVDAR
jgi:GAG-pre-integrase domain